MASKEDCLHLHHRSWSFDFFVNFIRMMSNPFCLAYISYHMQQSINFFLNKIVVTYAIKPKIFRNLITVDFIHTTFSVGKGRDKHYKNQMHYIFIFYLFWYTALHYVPFCLVRHFLLSSNFVFILKEINRFGIEETDHCRWCWGWLSKY